MLTFPPLDVHVLYTGGAVTPGSRHCVLTNAKQIPKLHTLATASAEMAERNGDVDQSPVWGMEPGIDPTQIITPRLVSLSR